MRKFWKRLQLGLFVTSFCLCLTVMILSQYFATDPKGHLVPDENHVIRLYSGRFHVDLSDNQNRLLNTLWIAFGVCFVCGGVIAMARGDIKGRRDKDKTP